jgi:ABC-2 type transport system permease protein
MTLPTWRYNLRVIPIAFEMALRSLAADSFVLFGILVQPLIIAVLAIWMLTPKGSGEAIFVVIGSGMTGLWTTLLFVGGNTITSERWTGTLESLVAQPTPISYVLFGKNLAAVLQSLLSMLASYSLAGLVFHLPLRIAQPGPFAVSVVLTVFAFVCFGLIIAPVFLLNPAVRNFENALEFPVYILAGFLFPIALLPGWTTPISYVLAPYWAARILHATSAGTASPSEMALCWGMMLVFGTAYLLVSRLLMRAVLRKARVDATLGLES